MLSVRSSSSSMISSWYSQWSLTGVMYEQVRRKIRTGCHQLPAFSFDLNYWFSWWLTQSANFFQRYGSWHLSCLKTFHTHLEKMLAKQFQTWHKFIDTWTGRVKHAAFITSLQRAFNDISSKLYILSKLGTFTIIIINGNHFILKI